MRTRGPLDPSPADREGVVAERWRWLRRDLPAVLYLLAAAVVLLAVLAGLGWLLAKVLSHDAVGRADLGVSRWFAAHRTKDLNEVTHWTTDLAETITVTALAAVTVVVSALAWRRWREPLLVAVAVSGEVIIFLLVTLLVDRPRPPVRHLDQAPPTSSFPSGHTAAAIVMYGALAVLASERARSAAVKALFVALAFLVPVVVAVSRIYRGMHFTSDVVGGAILGTAWLLASVRGVRLGVLHDRLAGGGAAGPERVRRRAPIRHG
ncbi:MAG TPA: phosphatase PAP2 family protein [Actinomycetes bacterium]|nr:phosphatase PAP2 family protein [Actinomycetes bacterium]